MHLNNVSLSQLLWLLIPVGLLELGLLLWALLDVIRRERVTGGNKVVWILVIVLISTIGPIVYLLFGRKEAPEKENEE